MRNPVTALVLIAGLVLSAGGVRAQAAPDWMTSPRDWGETLRADATAFHAAILDSHPGPVDPLNPGFRSQLDAGLALALERAETAADVGGWWWAMRALQAGFDDGHVQLWLTDQGYGFPARWAGVITVYRGDEQIVGSRDETDPAAPPLGARLVDCDGVAAGQLAEQRVGRFRGRWFLEAQRALYGTETLLNLSNPWAGEPETCRFETAGRVVTVAMNWRSIASEDLAARRASLNARVRPDFVFRRLDDGGFWVSMPSFDGTPGGQPFEALTAILDEAASRQAELRGAPYVVLDLRGNGGGSSHWSVRLAEILWGMEWLQAVEPPSSTAVDWRASESNQAAVADFLGQLQSGGADAELIAWGEAIVEGMAEARAAGEPYWRSASPEEVATAAESELPVNPMQGRVYVLTDPTCSSACLDAVDIWKPAGAVQIGRETSADTVYMDVREQALPSSLAGMALPMKVYRGRPRGNNEPHRPAHVFDGDLRDETAILAWIRTL